MSSEKRKVMIVDDNILNLKVVTELLANHGYEVVILASPGGCVAKLDFEQPDVLLIDITMPRLAADDVIEAIHNTADHEDLIVVLYADMEAEELERICHAKDINGYFCKSMDISKLPEFINRFF